MSSMSCGPRHRPRGGTWGFLGSTAEMSKPCRGSRTGDHRDRCRWALHAGVVVLFSLTAIFFLPSERARVALKAVSTNLERSWEGLVRVAGDVGGDGMAEFTSLIGWVDAGISLVTLFKGIASIAVWSVIAATCTVHLVRAVERQRRRHRGPLGRGALGGRQGRRWGLVADDVMSSSRMRQKFAPLLSHSVPSPLPSFARHSSTSRMGFSGSGDSLQAGPIAREMHMRTFMAGGGARRSTLLRPRPHSMPTWMARAAARDGEAMSPNTIAPRATQGVAEGATSTTGVRGSVGPSAAITPSTSISSSVTGKVKERGHLPTDGRSGLTLLGPPSQDEFEEVIELVPTRELGSSVQAGQQQQQVQPPSTNAKAIKKRDDKSGSGGAGGAPAGYGQALPIGSTGSLKGRIKRNYQVWSLALQAARRILKANKTDDSKAKTAAAEFLRDGLLELGPTFVKLGQVMSTRSDVLSPEFIAVLKSLQDEVPPFSGEVARQIVEDELGKPVEELFRDFDNRPLKAASLGQVHVATLKDGRKVAIKVQRPGLKEMFDVDLRNLKNLARALEAFDPKTDGADRDWAGIYDESARLLYDEIDYLNEAQNLRRFARDFVNNEWVKVPDVYLELSTPKVLTMEFVSSFKLTDNEQIKKARLDNKVLAKRMAEAFLRQLVETGYFHCDPHAGNMCVNERGQIVFYDFGMMDELRPNVNEGLKDFCRALFVGGPLVSETELVIKARQLAAALERMGVLARDADRIAVEKISRFFIRSFKDAQLGKAPVDVKLAYRSIGSDLQALTDEKGGTVFKFPPTFTFIFRAFASVEGIGKNLDNNFDLTLLAQPFVERFVADEDDKAGIVGGFSRSLQSLGRMTELDAEGISATLTFPRKIAYLEETVRAMEDGSLKIRTRSLENEMALNRLGIQVSNLQALVTALVLLQAGTTMKLRIPALMCFVGSFVCAGKAGITLFRLSMFDRNAAMRRQPSFED